MGNDDLGPLNGGELPFELQKGKMRDARCLIYGGTWPACYTLTLIEAMMTGLPIIALGKGISEPVQFERLDYYEVPWIVEDGVSGFVSDDIEELRGHVQMLIKKPDLAKQIGLAGRQRAIELFGRQKVAKLWEDYLKI
jgi:glycosyltransferase involved in cell wall biosynthesis